MAKSGKSRSKKDDTPESTETLDEALASSGEKDVAASDLPETDLATPDDPETTGGGDGAPDAENAVPDASETKDDVDVVDAGSDDAIESDDPHQAPDEDDGSETADEYPDDPNEGSEETDTDTDETEPEPEEYDEEEYEAPDPEPVPTREVVVQKVGFIPLLLGGGIAAGLGYLLAFFYYGQPGADYEAMISAQTARIGELEAQVASLPAEQPDLAPVAARIDQAQASQTALTERLESISGDLSAQIAAFDERLNAIERAPAEDGTLAETAIASWERELDALRQQFAEQEAQMQALTAEAQADLEAARAEAEEVERSAAEAAQAAIGRAALSRVQSALDSGNAFDAALADLQSAGADVPPGLSAIASEGAPTIASLRDEYPAAARAALSAARSEGLADDGANPLTAFLREQLDVRSVEPREGDDPDAILSRAEAALAEGRLTDALAEIEALPEVARAEMTGWIELATTRADAVAAAETIDQSLSN